MPLVSRKGNGVSVGGLEIKLHTFITSSLVKLRRWILCCVRCSVILPTWSSVKLFVVLLLYCVTVGGCHYVALRHTRHSPLLLVFCPLDKKTVSRMRWLLSPCSSVGMLISRTTEPIFIKFPIVLSFQFCLKLTTITDILHEDIHVIFSVHLVRYSRKILLPEVVWTNALLQY